jgi:hypothetical protein
MFFTAITNRLPLCLLTGKKPSGYFFTWYPLRQLSECIGNPPKKIFQKKKCGGPVRKFLKGTLYIKHPVRNYGEA